MKTLLKIGAVALIGLVLIGAGFFVWASMASSRVLARTIETHSVDFPVPFPLTDEEIEMLDPEADVERVAYERALERGRHLVESRYACSECHGRDFGGGVMVDAFPIGTLLGPNLTSGEGSRTAGYSPADWDRIVRHGVTPEGRPAAMPSEDYRLMSDRELSDIIVYLRAQPPVDNEVPPIRLGPLGKILVATGQLPLSADLIESHNEPHAVVPPPTAVSEEFGRHLAGVCTGCHRDDFSGGPIASGDPSWPPAGNLTPHADGLAEWSYDDFLAAMREGRRPDGTAIGAPMTLIMPYAQSMTDVEMEALWVYLRSIPARPTPGKSNEDKYG